MIGYLDSSYNALNRQQSNHDTHRNTFQISPNQIPRANQVNNNNNNVNNIQPNAQSAIYKIPTLLTRFMAELFDAFYIQLIKISLVIVIASYTDLL